MISIFTDGIVPRVGDWFQANEIWIKIVDEQKYLFARWMMILGIG